MPARRRRSAVRSAVQRLQMWDKKMSGEVYATLLPKLKEISIGRVAGYQVEHENLISVVKQVLSGFGFEASVLQEYMWFAEKLWKFKNEYSSEALQRQVDALYLWYLARGRSDLALRAVAKALGLNVSDLEDIVGKVMAPLLVSVLSKGVVTADGSEQTLIEYTGRIAAISGYIDLSSMVDGDTVVVRLYVRLVEEGDYVLYHVETFMNKQFEPALYVMPRATGFGYKVTLQQTSGDYKSFSYLFVKGV